MAFLYLPKGIKDYFLLGIDKIIADNYPPPEQKKFAVYLEKDIYRPKEDEAIWRQYKGRAPRIAEVYYEGKYVCDISESTHPLKAEVTILDKVKYLKNDDNKIQPAPAK